MAVLTQRWHCILLIYFIQLHMLGKVYLKEAKFKLISGTDLKKHTADGAPHIEKEFFLCGRDQSCTHVIELLSGFVLVHGSIELEKRKHEAVRIHEKVTSQGHDKCGSNPCQNGGKCIDGVFQYSCACLPGYIGSHCENFVESCKDVYKEGIRKNGIYTLRNQTNELFPVFCDFESEANSVWTLLTSFALKNVNLFRIPFTRSSLISEDTPNWSSYRLSKQRMEYIRSSSTMWRATCSFPVYKSDIYRDYMRFQISQVDMLTFFGNAVCCQVDRINIRGHVGVGITVALWQMESPSLPLQIDSSEVVSCTFSARVDSIPDEDNFGFYYTINAVFRCTESDESTTQYWFGVNV